MLVAHVLPRIFLDVDCSRETREGFTNKNNITEVLNGKKVLAEGETVSPVIAFMRPSF